MKYFEPLLPVLFMLPGCSGKEGADMAAEQQTVPESLEDFRQADHVF